VSARVAIVGAGIAGLAAGYRLKKAGLPATVFEKESFVGGRMSSELRDGFVIEKAAYTFPEYHKNLTAFLDELGMRHTLIQTPGTSSTFAHGREYHVKIGSPTDFLKHKLLSLKNKKDMVKLFLYAQSLGGALDMANPTAKTFEMEREWAADYILKNHGEEILEYVAWPIFCEIILGNPEDNSKVPFLATLKNLAWFKIFNFSEGMGMLPERLRQELDVRSNSPVQKVFSAAGEPGYVVQTGGEKPELSTFDAVIFAVPSPVVPDMLEGLSSEMKTHFQGIRYSNAIVTALAVDRRFPETSMINNLCRDNFKVVGTLVFDHHKGPDRAPEGKSLITAVLCEKASRSLLDEPEDKITQEVLKEVDILFPRCSDRLIFSRVYRWKHGGVQFPPGALIRQHEARTAIETHFDDIVFAGDGFYKTSLEVSFNTGLNAADKIIAKLKASGA